MGRQNERREFRRRDCLLLCPFKGERFRSDGHIVDISYGGAGISGTKKLPAEGTELTVEIRRPWKTIQLQARVVWVKSAARERGLTDFGTEFLGTLYERQKQLTDFFPEPNTI